MAKHLKCFTNFHCCHALAPIETEYPEEVKLAYKH